VPSHTPEMITRAIKPALITNIPARCKNHKTELARRGEAKAGGAIKPSAFFSTAKSCFGEFEAHKSRVQVAPKVRLSCFRWAGAGIWL
jgi:hypothetical protein